MEYRKAGDASWTPIEGTTVEGLAPGKYEIRYSATDRAFASEIAIQYISSFSMQPGQMDPVSIDYKNETLINLIQGEEYYINGISVTAGTGGVIEIQEEWLNSTISIVKVGDKIYVDDSMPQELDIPSRPDAPTEVKAVDESAKNKKDGKLINLKDTMEYQREGDVGWKAVTEDTVGGLAPGVYIVRFKANNESFCSEGSSYIIRGYEPEPEDKPAAMINFFEEILTGLKAGSAYEINISSAKPGAGDEIYADADGI